MKRSSTAAFWIEWFMKITNFLHSFGTNRSIENSGKKLIYKYSGVNISTTTLIIVVVFSQSACRYEAVTPEGHDEASQENTSSVEATINVTPLPLPTFTPCDGECSCDETTAYVNDTGMTVTGSDDEESNLPYCDTSALHQQDCNYGRDADASLIKSGSGNGGFDLSKIAGVSGTILNNDANDWACVLDNTTGRMWEVKQDEFSSGYANRNNTFSWSSSTLPSYSTENQGECNLQDGCDSQTYIHKVNQAKLCGFSDWRLPTKVELQDLVDYGSSQPSIDSHFFPHTVSDFYWTSSIDTDDINSIWAVDFNYGRVAGSASNGARYIRLVRDHLPERKRSFSASSEEQHPTLRARLAPRQRCNSLAELATPLERFRKDTSGNILDRATGLIWRRCVAGLSGEDCSEGEEQLMPWGEALSYATDENLSERAATTPWRIPNIKELQGMVETQCEEPALSPYVFPNMPLNHAWSSTPHQKQEDKSYYYQYQNGIIFYSDRTDRYLVHLVRDCR